MTPRTARWCRRASSPMKWSIRSGMSPALSRIGGSWIVTPAGGRGEVPRKTAFAHHLRRSRFVAATRRMSTRCTLFPPTGVTSRVSNTRRSFACVASGMSPTSSRKSVPPSACTIRPCLSVTAPVKAPRTCPKSSDSIKPSERAAQLTATKFFFARGLFVWIARATSSLPVPLSPRIRIVAFELETWPRISNTRCICGECPRIPSKP